MAIAPAARQLPFPEVLLLDFGGVVAEGRRRPEWPAELAAVVHGKLAAAGFRGLAAEEIRVDVEAAAAADRAWKAAMSRPPHPAETTHRRYWAELVAADWPEQARAVVTVDAAELCRIQGELRQERSPRPGIEDVLEAAWDAGVRVGVVSNALSGAVHRAFLERTGLDKRVALQLYSDEAGIRKPNPEMVRLAATALGAEPSACWYVGDHFDRDVVCGRRAGAGGVVLMEAAHTYAAPYPVRDRPDAVVADPHGLLALFTAARGR